MANGGTGRVSEAVATAKLEAEVPLTVKVASLLVAFPVALLTVTAKVAPLSPDVVAGVT